MIDKTGTLTEGKPRVVAVEAGDSLGEDELLRLAASLERSSEHPLATAIVEAARERGLKLVEPQEFDAPTGARARTSVAPSRSPLPTTC